MKAILFDLDGTLLPMVQEEFIEAYMQVLVRKLCSLGFAPEGLAKSVWKSTSAMINNDGKRSNEEVFWNTFHSLVKEDTGRFREISDAFYSGEFHQVKAATQDNPLAAQTVRLARKKADLVVLATNPLFPGTAQESRLSWIGLSREDFDLITSFETDSYCKPNPEYYRCVCRRIGVKPEECLMIGNDEREDMHPASDLGMDCFLVTDWVIRDKRYPWEGKTGSAEELLRFLNALPDRKEGLT